MGRYRCHLNLKSYQDFDSWCGEHGHRVTERRCTVAMIVLAARDDPDVDELHSRVRAANPRISLATLYRALRLLAESGLIERHTFRGGPARYRPVGDEHKDHLIDVTNDRVVEFRSGMIERLQSEIAAMLGYRLTGHKLELYGEPVRAPERHRAPIGARRTRLST